MDLQQTVFDVVIGIAGALGMVMLTWAGKEIKDIQTRLDDIPNVYARRDDVKDGFADMKDVLKRIEDKIERVRNG